jgi:hypothetical protein
MNDLAGRSCPIRYRYGAQALAQAPTRMTHTLYVVGGLYGNLPALDAIEAMAAQESGPVTICFNGDFNWFNVDDPSFEAINRRVLRHDAILGNVEAELSSQGDDAGCGCAYPAQVDAGVVERSNRIHARLKATAQRQPLIQARLAELPMLARYQVGQCRVGVVHGDADSLAGWRFDGAALQDATQAPWLLDAFARAQVDLFASSHTCQPVLHQASHAPNAVVINNGAAGMPNLRGALAGILTRIGVQASPHPALYGTLVAGVCVDALAVAYEPARWQDDFLANWPPGSDAYESYYRRIQGDLAMGIDQACGVG